MARSCRPLGPVINYNPRLVKTICNSSIAPETDQGQELLALWNQICETYTGPTPPDDPVQGEPVCVNYCPNPNEECYNVLQAIADILEL